MTDPTTPPIAAAQVAWLTAAVLAYIGVDYYALLGALGGVLITLSSMKSVGVLRLAGTVLVMTLVAGVLGQGFASLLHLDARPVVMVFSLLFGAGGQVTVQAGVGALIAQIRRLGGSDGNDGGAEGGKP